MTHAAQLPPGGAPCKWDPPVCRHDVVVRLLAQAPHEAKVPNLHHLPGRQQHVPRCQVAVDQPPALQVVHPRHDLRGKEPEADERVLELTRAQHVIKGTQGGQLRHLKGPRKQASQALDPRTPLTPL